MLKNQVTRGIFHSLPLNGLTVLRYLSYLITFFVDNCVNIMGGST